MMTRPRCDPNKQGEIQQRDFLPYSHFLTRKKLIGNARLWVENGGIRLDPVCRSENSLKQTQERIGQRIQELWHAHPDFSPNVISPKLGFQIYIPQHVKRTELVKPPRCIVDDEEAIDSDQCCAYTWPARTYTHSRLNCNENMSDDGSQGTTVLHDFEVRDDCVIIGQCWFCYTNEAKKGDCDVEGIKVDRETGIMTTPRMRHEGRAFVRNIAIVPSEAVSEEDDDEDGDFVPAFEHDSDDSEVDASEDEHTELYVPFPLGDVSEHQTRDPTPQNRLPYHKRCFGLHEEYNSEPRGVPSSRRPQSSKRKRPMKMKDASLPGQIARPSTYNRPQDVPHTQASHPAAMAAMTLEGQGTPSRDRDQKTTRIKSKAEMGKSVPIEYTYDPIRRRLTIHSFGAPY